MATDPVCGMQVDEATAAETAEHQGQTYYFCCKGCRMEFEDEPEKYLSREGDRANGGQGGHHGMDHPS